MKHLKDCVNDEKGKYWNIERVKAMKFQDFHAMVIGWSKGVERVIDGKKVTVGVTIFSPSEKDIRDKWKELTGQDAPKV